MTVQQWCGTWHKAVSSPDPESNPRCSLSSYLLSSSAWRHRILKKHIRLVLRGRQGGLEVQNRGLLEVRASRQAQVPSGYPVAVRFQTIKRMNEKSRPDVVPCTKANEWIRKFEMCRIAAAPMLIILAVWHDNDLTRRPARVRDVEGGTCPNNKDI